MTQVRIRGFLSVLAGAAIIAGPFWWIGTYDDRGIDAPVWAGPLLVAFCTPAFIMACRGLYSLVTGKPLGSGPGHIRL
jgi:hypothetical protein